MQSSFCYQSSFLTRWKDILAPMVSTDREEEAIAAFSEKSSSISTLQIFRSTTASHASPTCVLNDSAYQKVCWKECCKAFVKQLFLLQSILTHVKTECRGGIVITRNVELGNQDPGTNVPKNPVRGTESQRTRIPACDATRGRNLPSIKIERGEFLL